MVSINFCTLDVQYFTYHFLGGKTGIDCIIVYLEKLFLGIISTLNSFSETVLLFNGK